MRLNAKATVNEWCIVCPGCGEWTFSNVLGNIKCNDCNANLYVKVDGEEYAKHQNVKEEK